MKKLVVAFFAGLILFSGCTERINEKTNQLSQAKGDKFYGGVIRYNESEFVKNLFPPNIVDAVSYRVAAQVYEGLMRFNPETLDPEPALAESYSVDNSGTVYTFKLRKNVMFHDDPNVFTNDESRELTAEDVKWAFTRLATDFSQNQGSSIVTGVIKGAEEYYEASASGNTPDFDIEGIKVIDNYTIQFELEKPTPVFLHNLARPFAFIYPKEAYDEYGLEMRINAVGTGPFMIERIEEPMTIVLKKNPEYYRLDKDGNQLPYLEGIIVKFIPERKTELLEFKRGNLDMMYRLPTDFVIDILESAQKEGKEFSEYQIHVKPIMGSQIYAFNTQGRIFNNKNLRKSISWAIDRKRILDYVISGEGAGPGYNFITPPVDEFSEYNPKTLNGYSQNIDSATFYLNEAGYNDGSEVPTIVLDVNSDGEKNRRVAEEVKKQLKDNLNINVELNMMPHAQLIEKQMKGESDFFRLGWGADYPHPESFLWMFYSKDVPENIGETSYPNMMRYVNPSFDELYEQGSNAATPEKANTFFKLAEQVALEDAPVVVLWYDERINMLQPYVRNFKSNAMQYWDLSEVFMVPEDNAPSDAVAEN